MPPVPEIVIGEYWNYDYHQLREFLLSNFPHETRCEMRKHIHEGGFINQKQQIWRECEKAGVSAIDVSEQIGGDPGHLRRAFLKGKPTDAALACAIELAELDYSGIAFLPSAYDYSVSKTSEINLCKHLWENTTTLTPSHLQLTLTPDRLRVPANSISPEQGLLLQTLFVEDLTDYWLELAQPCIFDITILERASSTKAFLDKLYLRSRVALDFAPEEAKAAFESNDPQNAGLQASLRMFIAAWNSCQLYAAGVNLAYRY